MAEATDGTEGAPGAETEADLVAALPPQNRPRASIVSSQYWTWIQLLEDNDPRSEEGKEEYIWIPSAHVQEFSSSTRDAKCSKSCETNEFIWEFDGYKTSTTAQ